MGPKRDCKPALLLDEFVDRAPFGLPQVRAISHLQLSHSTDEDLPVGTTACMIKMGALRSRSGEKAAGRFRAKRKAQSPGWETGLLLFWRRIF